MPATTLSFLADMNLSPMTVESLRDDGLDILRVSDVMMATSTDVEILAYARETARVIITQDLDFSALIAVAGYATPSLITLRLGASDPNHVTNVLRRVIPHVAEALQQGSAVTIDERRIRVRQLPIRL